MDALRDTQRSASMPCRLCGGPSTFKFLVGDRNRGLGPGRFEYRLCEACGAIAMTEVPHDLDRYYAIDGYGSAAQEMTPELVRREQAKLELMAELEPPAEIIEIGPGPGLFTRSAKAAGFALTALEMDAHYCQDLSERFDVRAIQTTSPEAVLPTLPACDAVVMWHVLEHLPNPWEVLARSAEKLAPGGLLGLSTPNPDSLQYRALGRYWTHVDAPRHLQLIPIASLERKLAQLGMRKLRVTTSDPVGQALNRSGWEAVVRRHPARHPPTMNDLHVARAITLALAPFERRGLGGAAYTAVFARDEDGAECANHVAQLATHGGG
ncbi:MAG: class I SAM-dependent methyltransferase [Solirubrobacteraceae bacterium]